MFLALPAPISSRGDAQGRRMAEDENGEVPKLPPDARLESLDERLDRFQQAETKRASPAPGDPKMGVGQVVLGYIIGGPLGGGLLGWGLDSLFGTKPWLTLVMLLLGFGVGIRNVLRISRNTPSQGPGEQS